MTLAERLSEYVRACFTGLWIRTHEPDDAAAEIIRLSRDQGWSVATWDVDRGLAPAGRAAGPDVVPGAADPLAAIRALPALATPDGTALLVLRNFHRFTGSPEVVQALDTQLAAGKQARTFVVILSPLVQVPVELEKLFVVVEHDLPGRDQLEMIARGVATEPGELPAGDGLDAVLDAAAGLTRLEAENAFRAARPPRLLKSSASRWRVSRPLLVSACAFSSQTVSARTAPSRTTERLKAPSASNRVSPAAASSTPLSSSPPGSSPGSVAIDRAMDTS